MTCMCTLHAQYACTCSLYITVIHLFGAYIYIYYIITVYVACSRFVLCPLDTRFIHEEGGVRWGVVSDVS